MNGGSEWRPCTDESPRKKKGNKKKRNKRRQNILYVHQSVSFKAFAFYCLNVAAKVNLRASVAESLWRLSEQLVLSDLMR